MTKKAIYLAGGGARGAYQAGVLKAIDKILEVKELPFDIISGVSVGSLNAVVLAEYADDFPQAVKKIVNIWQDIECQKIFNASNYSLGKSVLRNLSTIIMKQRQSGFLLDTSPLKKLIEDSLDLKRLHQNINNKTIEAVEIIVNNYEAQQTISFFDHCDKEFADWNYPRHTSKKMLLHHDHILASTSLPLFFPQ